MAASLGSCLPGDAGAMRGKDVLPHRITSGPRSHEGRESETRRADVARGPQRGPASGTQTTSPDGSRYAVPSFSPEPFSASAERSARGSGPVRGDRPAPPPSIALERARKHDQDRDREDHPEVEEVDQARTAGSASARASQRRRTPPGFSIDRIPRPATGSAGARSASVASRNSRSLRSWSYQLRRRTLVA